MSMPEDTTEDRMQTGKVKITGQCEKCGRFEVIRKRGKRVRTNGEVHDLPQSVVCPNCRMWGRVVMVEEITK